MTIKLTKPTLFSSALIIALISTFLVFIIVEVMLNLIKEFGGGITLSALVILIMFIGITVSGTIMFGFVSRRQIYRN